MKEGCDVVRCGDVLCFFSSLGARWLCVDGFVKGSRWCVVNGSKGGGQGWHILLAHINAKPSSAFVIRYISFKSPRRKVQESSLAVRKRLIHTPIPLMPMLFATKLPLPSQRARIHRHRCFLLLPQRRDRRPCSTDMSFADALDGSTVEAAGE